MVQINSINHSPLSDLRLRAGPVRRTRAIENLHTPVIPDRQQILSDQSQIDRVSQLPQGQAGEVTDIFRSINIIANQALEPGQDFENRENLQAGIDENISDLKSVLSELSQDDLKLFVAIFQSQLPDGLINTGGTSDNPVSDLSFNDISNNSLESLLNLDVTTESGALTTLDLTGSIIDTLSINNNNSNLLESLLDYLIG